MNEEAHYYTNALINETSPYLLQHAHNPVNWHAWSSETLGQAQEEDKLLIISIGYSACHWCHVMEHESFEDSLVADLMNKNFISIKVDREERPDIDDIYMTACNLVTGRGGWPLNAIALPDGKPIWAGTYFPKDQWIKILKQFADLKENNYSKLEESAQKLVSGLQQVDAVIDVAEDIEFKESDLKAVGENAISNIDFNLGGLKGSQKFPLPVNYEFLLKYAYKYPESRALEAVETTLNAMLSGGIYDHIEGGFARYTVDKEWKVPHFEKMLYDNGQLISLYAQAYKLTKNKAYQRVVEESVDFLRKNWKDSSGGYYSSYDADSEGEEGKFYVWTKEELSKIIDPSEFDLFCQYFNIEEEGNWEDQHNIFYLDRNRNKESKDFLAMRDKWRKSILAERQQRVFPGLDDKLLCSWNGMLLNGYVEAYKAFGDQVYLDEALSIWNFIENNLLDADGSRLNRNYKDGRTTINGFLDDYAQVISGLINLYEATFDEAYLSKADQLMQYAILHFKNEASSMFNFTSDLDPPLVVNKSELTDGPLPASNSVTSRNLYKLGLLLYNNDYTSLSKQMMRNMKNSIDQTKQPNFYANWCSLYFDMVFEPYEVAILGPDYKKISAELMSSFHPNALYLGGAEEGSLKLLEDKLQEGENFVYVCVNKSCKLPVQTAPEALKLLE